MKGHFLIISVIALLFSCNQSSNFNDFTSNFSESPNNMYDSSFFANNFKISDIKLSMMPDEQRTLAKDEMINKLSGEQYTYEVYYLNKYELDDFIILSYFLTLNRDIPFDAYIQRVILGTYNKETGELIDSEEIATLEQHFGNTIQRFANWNGNTVTMEYIELLENMDDNSVTSERKDCSASIEEHGNIEIACR
ncbi:MAG: hypothetical protein ABJG99_17770 [Crocinitomicaceae bacterium]